MKTKRAWLMAFLLIGAVACRGLEDDPFGFSSGGGDNACNTLLYVIPCIVYYGIGGALGSSYSSAAEFPGPTALQDGAEVAARTTVTLAGSAFVSPDDWRCCPADPGVSVDWINRETGESGVATSIVIGADGGAPPTEWRHEWRADVRIAPGNNTFWLTAYDRTGNHSSISITLVGR